MEVSLAKRPNTALEGTRSQHLHAVTRGRSLRQNSAIYKTFTRSTPLTTALWQNCTQAVPFCTFATCDIVPLQPPSRVAEDTWL